MDSREPAYPELTRDITDLFRVHQLFMDMRKGHTLEADHIRPVRMVLGALAQKIEDGAGVDLDYDEWADQDWNYDWMWKKLTSLGLF